MINKNILSQKNARDISFEKMYTNNQNKRPRPFIDVSDILQSNVHVHAITKKAWPFIIHSNLPKGLSPEFLT